MTCTVSAHPPVPGTFPARVVKFKCWPSIDQDLWITATTWDPDELLKPPAAKLRPTSLRNAMRANGRLLAVLEDYGVLDPSVPPAQRLTPDLANLFVRALILAGNCNNTIKQRLLELRVAMKLMEPKTDTAWLVRPGGWGLSMWLPVEMQRRELVGISRIYALGLKLMGESDQEPTPMKRALMMRNGLIFAIFAARAPRLRAQAALEVGHQVQFIEDDCWLLFNTEDIKTNRVVEYRTPPDLAPFVARYLARERLVLLQGQNHKAMWVGQGGAPLDAVGIDGMFRRQTKITFGRSFGTHQCRHELASALADAQPENPGLSAAILAISIPVAEKSYTHARNDLAAKRSSEHLASEREQTHLLARRLFGEDVSDLDYDV